MKIRKRTWTTKSGIQTAWIVDYYDTEGNRQRQQFKKHAEAKQWGRHVEAELDAGTHVPDSKTAAVSEAAQLWLDKAETEGLEKSTKRQYQTHVDLHICPFDDEGFTVNGVKLAEIKLSRLTKPQIEKFRDYLLKHNSRAMARKILVSFKSILNEAKRQGLIARNPADEVVIKEDMRNKPLLTEGRDFPSRHSLRHFCASVWIEQGFSAKRLQTMLGHATITVTFDLYGHMLDRAEDDRARMAAGRAWVLDEDGAAAD